METRLDRKRKAAEIRAEREKNIAALEKELAEARDIYRVIANENSTTAWHERQVVTAHIKELERDIADERGAIAEAENAAKAIDTRKLAAQMVGAM